MAYAPNILAGRNFLLEAANRKSNGAKELELAVHMACELEFCGEVCREAIMR